MIPIDEIREVFEEYSWEERLEENPRRLYAFLLATDEHRSFLTFMQRAWRTLDALSGDYCDIFTYERWEIPSKWEIRAKKENQPNYIPLIQTNILQALYSRGLEFDVPLKEFIVNDGILLPNRTQCFEVRNRLFENPSEILLPGLALFPSADSKEALYYRCGGLNHNQLSESFQRIFSTVAEINQRDPSLNRNEIFNELKKTEKIRDFKERLNQVTMQISLKDVFDILGAGIRLVMPTS